MKRLRWAWLLLLLGIPACGGSMGMDRGPLAAVAAEEPIQIDDQRIAEALAQRPQLPDRVSVGVYFRDPPDGSWRWSFEDRERVIDAAETVERVTLFPISRSFIEGTDLMSLRLAAARHGAHALLVIEGRSEQETSDNGWLATYPLLLPVLFAPAQELDSRFTADASMYDVRNGFLYVTAEAEGFEEQQRAHVWIDHEGGVVEARRRSIEHLHEELRERLAHLLGEHEDQALTTAPSVEDATPPEPTPSAASEPAPAGVVEPGTDDT